jgi:hypothetical protein
MRPGDHPDFFRLPPPEGRSRESAIRLDADGRFWHDGRPVDHVGLRAGLHAWIRRHPDDGRYILSNGYDWTYFTVDDAPYVVRSLREEPGRIVLVLSDQTEEPWIAERTRVGDDGSLYAEVKAGLPGGPFEAKFSRHAQTSLGPWLHEDASSPSGAAVRVGSELHAIGAKKAAFE